jgi:hypothetical protein
MRELDEQKETFSIILAQTSQEQNFSAGGHLSIMDSSNNCCIRRCNM